MWNPDGGDNFSFGGMDVMEVEILPDGTIKFSTDSVSGANHANAEMFLREVARMAGGEVKRTAKDPAAHTHTHGHEHVHHTH